MEKPEFNKVTAIFGERGSGKTEYLRGNPAFGLPGFIRGYLKKDMKVLIVDTLDHASYRDIARLPIAKLQGWNKGVYRCWVEPDEMPDLTTYINQLDSMYNTFIVFEDAYKHMENLVPKPMSRLMIDSKQKNIDMVFMFHGFSFAPPKLFGLIDLIEIFKTKDHPECRKTKMRGYYDDALKLYEEVKASANPYYHKLIVTGQN